MGEQTRKLTKEAQMFVVASHARYEGNETIIEGLRNLFNVELASASITYYNPTYLSKLGKFLQPELQKHFDYHRQLFITNVNSIAGSSQVFRLAELQEMASDAKKKKNYPLAAKLYEQMARELGGLYIAKNYQLQHSPLGNIEHEDASITDEQRAAAINAAIASTNAGAGKEET